MCFSSFHDFNWQFGGRVNIWFLSFESKANTRLLGRMNNVKSHCHIHDTPHWTNTTVACLLTKKCHSYKFVCMYVCMCIVCESYEHVIHSYVRSPNQKITLRLWWWWRWWWLCYFFFARSSSSETKNSCQRKHLPFSSLKNNFSSHCRRRIVIIVIVGSLDDIGSEKAQTKQFPFRTKLL